MKVAATQYSINYQAFEIYLSGCNGKPHCKNCHNPELWDFEYGDEYDIDMKERILKKISDFSELVENIWILGGEPLDNDIDCVIKLLTDINLTRKKVWLFTRNELKDIPQSIKQLVDYIKTGRYLPDEKSGHVEYGVTLASKNQHIYKRGKDFE